MRLAHAEVQQSDCVTDNKTPCQRHTASESANLLVSGCRMARGGGPTTRSCSRSKRAQPLLMRSLILASHLSHAFVARGEEDDKHEREEEREGTGDAPLAEDDAEVFP